MKKSVKKRIIEALIPLIILGGIALAILYSGQEANKEELLKLKFLSQDELSFLKQGGFLTASISQQISRKPPQNREETLSLLKSPALIEQDLNTPDESFEVLATKLDLEQGNYQLAFKLENKSNQEKDFYLIPVSDESQAKFQEISGQTSNADDVDVKHLSFERCLTSTLSDPYDVEKHRAELKPELAQAYDDIEKNNYRAQPIKLTLNPKSSYLAQSVWELKTPKINQLEPVKPVYFLVYGSAGGTKDDLIIGGLEILVKVGDKRQPDDPYFEYDWRDGQIIDFRPAGSYIRPDGSCNGEMTCKHFAVIQLPSIDYWELVGAKNFDGLKQGKPKYLAVKKYTSAAYEGKYPWDDGYIESEDRTEEEKSRIRDWFVDFKWLLEQGLINQEQYESIYDKRRDHLPIVIDRSLEDIIRNEDKYTRLPGIKSYGTIDASGTYTVGTGQTYATWSSAIADLPADFGAMTTPGNIILKGNITEEIIESTAMIISLDTDIYTLTLTVDDAHVHNGGAYGNGHRVNLTIANKFMLDETTNGTMNNVIFEKLAIDASGSANYGIQLYDGGDTGHLIVQKCVIQGDGSARYGIDLSYSTPNAIIRNNVVYGFMTATYSGLLVYAEGGTLEYAIYNNTICKNIVGIKERSATPVGNVNVDNNLFQGNTTDWSDPNSGLDSGGKNVSEDATSPDEDYDNLNCHDGNSCFVDYTNNDFRLVATGDELTTLDDGNDKSGIGSPEQFTDDIQGQTRSIWYSGASEYISPTPQILKIEGSEFKIEGSEVKINK